MIVFIVVISMVITIRSTRLFCDTQLPIGSTFNDPGYYAYSSASGKSNPVTVTSALVTGEAQTLNPKLEP